MAMHGVSAAATGEKHAREKLVLSPVLMLSSPWWFASVRRCLYEQQYDSGGFYHETFDKHAVNQLEATNGVLHVHNR